MCGDKKRQLYDNEGFHLYNSQQKHYYLEWIESDLNILL